MVNGFPTPRERSSHVVIPPQRVIILSFLLLLPLAAPAQTEWLEFNAGTQGHTSPLVQYNGTWDDLLTFDVEVRGLLADTVEVDSVRYLRFSRSPGLTVADSTGYPEMPVARCFVWVPDNTDLSLSWAANCPQATASIPIYPAPLDSLREDSTSTPYIDEFFRKDSTAYASEQWYPDTLARLVGTFHLRDTRVAIVDVYPMQYLASTDSIRVWSDIEVALEFDEPGYDWSTADLGPYERLIGERLLGYEPDPGPWTPVPGIVMRPEDLVEGPSRIPDYVILTAAGLDGWWVDSLARHRANLNGFDVAIVRTDSVLKQFGDSAERPTAAVIRDFTEAMWDWGQPSSKRPSYLLLIGDHEVADSSGCDWFLPTRIHTLPGDWEQGNDDWFSYFGEPRSFLSAFPDMITGRLPARDVSNLQDMIELIREFEEESVWPPPSSLAWRRDLVRLSGYQSGASGDSWIPSRPWTASLADWCGYDLVNHYCGDGDASTLGDGSSYSSGMWVDSCTKAFEKGAQIAFYSDHGGVHYFECAMDPDLGSYAGRPDSTFDDYDVDSLMSGGGPHGHPFVLLLCCSSGTFNWTEALQYNSTYSLWNCYTPDTSSVQYDFDVDCMAEEFMKNVEGGAIGVYGYCWEVSCLEPSVGYDLLEELLWQGNTRIGDAIAGTRISRLDHYWHGGDEHWYPSLGTGNLLGDPAVDIGDRVKFRDMCDLIISPEDLEINRYPTRAPGGSSEIGLFVTVRNAGGSESGPFDVDLAVTPPGQSMVLLTERCAGLDPGEEETLALTWETSWNPPGTVGLSAEADPEEDCDDSWTSNNSAEVDVEVIDLYPNDDGWPVKVPGSILPPPALGDLDEDGVLEIVTTAGPFFVAAYSSTGDELWQEGLNLGGFGPTSPAGGYAIPAIGNVSGDAAPEVVVNALDGLFVLDGDTGSTIALYQHEDYSGIPWKNQPRTVVLADLQEEPGQVPPRDEIVFVLRDSLHVLRCEGDSIAQLDVEHIDCIYHEGLGGYHSWQMACDLNGSGPDEIVVTGTVNRSMGGKDSSSIHIYDFSRSQVTDSEYWEGVLSASIPAAAELAGSTSIAMSRKRAISDSWPAYILDDNLALQDSCEYNPSRESEHVLCCMMADWTVTPGLDRIIAPAENQCFVWNDEGYEDWFGEYENLTGPRPPFGALGNLDGDARDAELLVASREGVVYGFAPDGEALTDLNFPYTLPSEVYGGFVIADIDNDSMVEVVFGTMDNYLHVWELGSCDEGYAPWPQCQHDAQRTGVLE